MLTLFSIVHVLVCLFLILVVLLQQGKGADLSVFGGGGTQAAFGARGATTLLHKLTVGAFVAFILTTMGIGFLKSGGGGGTVLQGVEESTEEAPAPATEEPAAEATAGTEATDAATGEEASPVAGEPAEQEGQPAEPAGDQPADDGTGS